MASEETRSLWRYLSGDGGLGEFFKEAFIEIAGGLLICAALGAVIAALRPDRSLLGWLAIGSIAFGAYGSVDLVLRQTGRRTGRPNPLDRVAHRFLILALLGGYYLMICNCPEGLA
jgi:hypothetical protein